MKRNRFIIVFVIFVNLSISIYSQITPPIQLSKFASPINFGFEDYPTYYWYDIVDTCSNGYITVKSFNEEGVKLDVFQYLAVDSIKIIENKYPISGWPGDRLILIQNDNESILYLQIVDNVRVIGELEYWNVPSLESRDTAIYKSNIGLGYDYKVRFLKNDSDIIVELINEAGKTDKFICKHNCSYPINIEEIIPAYIDKSSKAIIMKYPKCEFSFVDFFDSQEF